MRDIGTRIRRYRLARYAGPGRLRVRWLLPLILGWLVWAAALGEHSLLRIAKVSRESERSRSDLARTREELVQLERQLRDPAERRRLAEHALRERSGWARPGEIVYRIPAGPDSAAR